MFITSTVDRETTSATPLHGCYSVFTATEKFTINLGGQERKDTFVSKMRHYVKGSPEIRFNEHWIPEPYSGCWLWDSKVIPKGYGQININGKHQYAHRFSWELKNGEIPKGMFVCHKCDTPSCVNPDHLFLGNHLTNNRDAKAKLRHQFGVTHHACKLTEKQVSKIREDQRSPKSIAAEYGITRENVYKIKSKSSWRHL